MKLEDEKDASIASTRMKELRALERKLSSMILFASNQEIWWKRKTTSGASYGVPGRYEREREERET